MRENYILSVGNEVYGWIYTTWIEPHSIAELKDIGPAHLINQLFVVKKHRGKGVATELLTKVTGDADWDGVTLILDFQPGEFRSDPPRLQKLYEQFGFSWAEEIGGMIRKPTKSEKLMEIANKTRKESNNAS